MILLTAFKGNNNSSNVLLNRISSFYAERKLLTNSFDACRREIIEAISICRPDYVISFGIKPVINRLYIEPEARSNGICISTNFNISYLTDNMKKYNLHFKLSSKPSNYLCNHVYWHGLDYIRRNMPETKMIFIHVPEIKRFQSIDSTALWLNSFCKEFK